MEKTSRLYNNMYWYIGQHTTSGLAKLGGKVITRISVRPLTVSGNPNSVQLYPQLRQAAGMLAVMRQKVIERVIWINKIVASRKNIFPKSQNAENQKNVG